MNKVTVILCLTLLFACSATLSAATPERFSPEQLASLATIKHKVNGVRELAAAGVLTAEQAESATNKYLSDAAAIADRRISLEDLSNVPDGTINATWLSKTAERIADWITFGNTVVTLGVLGLVAGFLIIFHQAIIDLVQIFKDVPVIFYEVFLYAFGLGIVAGGRVWTPEYGYFLGLFGCLLLSGAVALSFIFHASKKNNPSIFFLIITFIFAAGALYYASALIGGFAVFCLIAALSFEDALDNLSGMIGLAENDALARVTTASYVLIAGHLTLKLIGAQIPSLQIFEPGILYLGSFGGYAGMLVFSGSWHFNRYSGNYLTRQIAAIIAGAAALVAGLGLGMPVLQKIGGTFLALYLLEKLFEIIRLLKISDPYSLGAVIILTSAMLAGAGMAVIRNQDFFSKYLLFL